MAKVSIISEAINSTKIVKAKNVTSVLVSNHSLVATSFIFNGVVRNLPDKDTLVPVQPFQISDSGNHFDVVLNFNQQNNNLILDYTEIISTTKEC